jgi:hypothetical protein
MRVYTGSLAFAVGLLVIVRSPGMLPEWQAGLSAGVGVALVTRGLALLFSDLKRSLVGTSRPNDPKGTAEPGATADGGGK